MEKETIFPKRTVQAVLRTYGFDGAFCERKDHIGLRGSSTTKIRWKSLSQKNDYAAANRLLARMLVDMMEADDGRFRTREEGYENYTV